MANDDEQRPMDPPDYMRHIRPDVPTSGAIVKSQNEARALALKISGKTPPNECHFNCPVCGWDKTLQFEPLEIEALGGDIESYSGPCPSCDNMTLVPRTHLMGEEFTPAYARARENMRKQYEEQADVFMDKATERLADIMPGVGGARTPSTAEVDAEPPPDLGELTPRKSEP